MAKLLGFNYETIDRYIKHKSQSWTETTCRTARAKLRKLYSFEFKNPMEMLNQLKKYGYNSYTIAVYFQIWKNYERFCFNNRSTTDEFMKQNRKLFRNVYKEKIYVLSMEEYRKCLLDAKKVSPAMYNFILLMGGSGLRLSEALQASWKDVSSDAMLRVNGKGDKIRFVPVPLEQLYPMVKIGHELIAGFQPPYIKFFKTRPYTAHDLRAFFATQLSSVMTIAELTDLLGHSDFNTTMRYIRRNPTVMKGKLNGYYERIHGAVGSVDPEDQREGTGR